MKKSKTIFLAFMAILVSGQLFAQSISPATLNSSGGSSAIAGGSVEWSIGEMTLVHTASAGSLIVTQGILQPNASTTSVKSVALQVAECSIFPNPVQEVIYVKLQLGHQNRAKIQLTDVMGKVLLETTVSPSSTTTIPMNSFANGHYFIKVESRGVQPQSSTFSLLKN